MNIWFKEPKRSIGGREKTVTTVKEQQKLNTTKQLFSSMPIHDWNTLSTDCVDYNSGKAHFKTHL